MKKQILFAACTLFAASALLMTSCQQAEEPIANDPTDQAGPMTRAATLGNFYRVVYVEVNDVNPLNAGEYLLSDGTPFFTHVILFASNIRGDDRAMSTTTTTRTTPQSSQIPPSTSRRSRQKVSRSSWATSATTPVPDSPTYRSTNRYLHG